jgi:hypothetical protein
MLAARRAGIHEATGAFIMGTASAEAMVAASLGLTSKAKLPARAVLQIGPHEERIAASTLHTSPALSRHRHVNT